jgi:hypothetical protein
LANQQLVLNGDKTAGFINPAIYTENATSAYATDFHDVTSGTSGSYSAVTGYDLVTGWGSPNGSGLINALAPVSKSPNFSISASPSAITVTEGTSSVITTTSISTAIGGGFSSAIALSATGQPSGVTVSFNPTSIPAPGSGSSTMSIAVAPTTTPGTYSITVTGSGEGITHATTVSLTVAKPVSGNFTVSVSPTSGSLRRGQSGYAVVTTAISGTFDSSISFSASGVPSGVTYMFNPASVSAPGSGTTDFILSASRSAPTGTYSITITATGGGITHTTVLTLQID